MNNRIPEPFPHQEDDSTFLVTCPRAMDTSDPGTGKTRTAIMYMQKLKLKPEQKVLVLAPKSILDVAWGEDLKKFAPELTYSIATALNRREAFDADAQIYITNHDAVRWMEKNPHPKFHLIIIDEITAYKHRTSLRSKAAAKIVKDIARRLGMSGTLNGNTILDVWHPTYLIDGGKHLGENYWAFRQVACEPKQVGPSPKMIQWVDKPDIEIAVGDIVRDMTIRNKFEDCHNIPKNRKRSINFTLNPKHMKLYEEFVAEARIELESGNVSAIHAGSLATKLLQIASGAVYDEYGVAHLINTDRYELITDLIEEREQCLVAFSWKHQRDQLLKFAKARKFKTGLIDGSANDKERADAVQRFQAGDIKVIYAHWQSASHGLTLTKGTTTIWSSPIHNAEYFTQFNRRLYRAGQDKSTETLLVTAKDTVEQGVYTRMDTKLSKMDLLLAVLNLNKMTQNRTTS